MSDQGSPHPLAGRLVEAACAKGADEADAIVVESTSLDVSVRMGKTESSERAEGLAAGLRVISKGRQATVSATEADGDAIEELAARAMAMAEVTPEDPFAGLPAKEERPALETLASGSAPNLPPMKALRENAATAEEAARAVTGITNSDGGHAAAMSSHTTLAASDGFEGSYRHTMHMLSATVVAGEGTAMERDYEYVTCTRAEDLDDPAELGRRAGMRAVARLNPCKAASNRMPVVFEPRVASSFLGHLAGAVSGAAVARGTTFLKDSLGERIFASGIEITDDPLRPLGHYSRPFDGEGSDVRGQTIVADGILKTWLLDVRSARQLGLSTTGSAMRGVGGVPGPGPSNMALAPGKESPEELIAGIEQGFFVTQMMGMSFNLVTGDYSRGAAGFWIERGEKAYPVSEVTVAGNLADMFMSLRPANDLTFRTGIDSPTVCIDDMTVAGL